MNFKVNQKGKLLIVTLAYATILVEEDSLDDMGSTYFIKSFASKSDAVSFYLKLKALKSHQNFYEQVKSDFLSLNREY